MSKPSIPKGTRDFLPLETVRRQYIFDTIRRSFEKYGYAPIETPAMENLSTLMGKYGEEGDRLIFRILESGESAKNILVKLRDENLDFVEYSKKWFNQEFRTLLIQKVDSAVIDGTYNDYMAFYNSLKNELEKTFVSGELRFLKEDQPEFFKTAISFIVRGFYYFMNADNVIFVDVNSGKLTDQITQFELLKRNLSNDEVKSYRSQRDFLVDAFFKDNSFIFLAFSTLDDLRKENISNSVTSKALRYDLTVPFARYVVMNFNELAFPFKRYQIQPVWRADRPQKGRYREFYQCDADVVGSDSLLYEVELIQLFDEVLSNLGLSDFTIKINNRKILSGIAEVAGVADKIIDITVAIDKLDKIGLDGVMKELREREIPEAAITKLQPLFSMSGSNEERLVQLEGLLKSSDVGMKGIAELRTVFGHISELPLGKAKLQLDVTLARGLNYYTGAIFEVAAGGVQIGSICGGGRYDDLTGIFGKEGLSGVGISFGADRIYDVLNELKLFPENLSAGTTVLFLNFGENESRYALKLLKELRDAGVSAEIYPEDAKLKKQMKYADAKGVKFVAMAGGDEMAKGEITLKNMKSGDQQTIDTQKLIQHFADL